MNNPAGQALPDGVRSLSKTNDERHQRYENVPAVGQPVFVYLVSSVVVKDALFLQSGLRQAKPGLRLAVRQVTRRNLPGYYDLLVLLMVVPLEILFYS